jgi:lipoprotein-anchoring transpeptidase ErfK/SrfK
MFYSHVFEEGYTMRKTLTKSHVLIPMILFLLAVTAFSAIVVTNTYASTTPWAGITTGTANVRSGTNTGAGLVAVYGANTRVTVYATVSGQVVWSGISAWYRISPLKSAPRYIYGGLVNHLSSGSPPPSAQGHLIVVSTSKQVLHAYLNGRLVYTSLVTTGMPALYTPTGTWHIYGKVTNVTFHSPWPKGSPYYYAPEFVHYVLEYDAPYIYLHDATWRTVFGPGTEYPHKDPKFGEETGSHGCVDMPLTTAAWLYHWAPVGTTVQIVK